MSIKLGNTDINKIYLGPTEIKKAYLGSTLIYDKTAVSNGLLNNLVSYYEFENNVLDSQGTNNGTNFGTSDVAGKIGRGRSFDGVNDYINTNLVLSGDNTTIGLWYYHTVNSGEYLINQGYLTGENGRWGVQVTTGGNLLLFQNPGNVIYITSSSTLTLNSWNYIQIKRSNSGGTWELLLNTVSEGIDTGGISLPTEGLILGRIDTTYINAIIDELGVWNRKLNTTDDGVVYNSGNGLSYDNFTT